MTTDKTPAALADERARFEAWVATRHDQGSEHVMATVSATDDRYQSPVTSSMWSAWQAANVAREGGRINGWQVIDGVRVYSAFAHASILDDQQYVRYEDYLAALSAQPSPGGQDAAIEAMADSLYCAQTSATMEEARQQAQLLLIDALPHLAARQPVERSFQAGVAEWMGQCFLPSLYSNMTERGDRLLEEVLELLQAHGYDKARVPTLVDYVFGRPVGEPAQEVGGVMVTLAGYCWVAGLDMHAAGDAELARISQPDVMARIRAKQEAKNALHFDTPLPGNAARQPVGERPMEMRICELRHVSLKPNRPYIFTVDANCANCRADAAYAMGHTDARPAQAVDLGAVRNCLRESIEFVNHGYGGHARRKAQEALALIDSRDPRHG